MLVAGGMRGRPSKSLAPGLRGWSTGTTLGRGSVHLWLRPFSELVSQGLFFPIQLGDPFL